MSEVIVLIISYVARTALLTLLLWIMIQFQKLNYSFLPLLGAAMLASALDMIPYFGHYLAVPVLYLCVWKITQASLMPDAIFTVVVAYALMFAVNVMLLTWLMPDIHVATGYNQSEPRSSRFMTNPMPAATVAGVTNHPGTATPDTKSADDWLKDVVVKGATENGDKSMLLISANKKTYTLVMNEQTLVHTTTGDCHIRLVSISAPWATVEVNGEAAYMRMP